MYDIDSDKKLSLNEIENIIKAIYKFCGQKEKDSQDPKQVAKSLLKKFDRDENGFLTSDEFVDEAITFHTLHAMRSFSILRNGLKDFK